MDDRLYIKLFQLRRRQALVQGLQRGLRAGLWGGWLCVPLLLLFTWLRLPGENLWHTLWVWPLFAGAGFLHGLLTPMSLRQVAHEADRLNDLQDRLLTCLSHLQARRAHTVLSQLLLQETLQKLDQIDPRRTFPGRWRKPLLRWLVPALAVAAVFLVAPEVLPPPPPDPLQQQVLVSQQRLNQLARRMANGRPRSRAQQQLQAALQRMPQQVPGQAARQLRNALQGLQRQLAEQTQLGRQLEELAKGGKLDAQKLEKLRQQMARQQPSPQTQARLEQAQKSLSQGQREAAQQALKEAGKQLQSEQQFEGQQELNEAIRQEISQLDPQQSTQNDAPSTGDVGNPGGPPRPGQGKGQADFGLGSTNQQAGKQREARQKARSHRQNQEQRHKTGQFEQLYAADRKYLKNRRERVALNGGKGRLLRMGDSQLGDPRNQDPSLRPEQVDFLSAKAQAEQSVAEERVPPEHRDAVRRYFDQLDPR